jgi:CheY-like chemotaxis protein
MVARLRTHTSIRVLIVDDNKICTDILARVFSTKRFSALPILFEITIVSSAEEALEYLKTAHYNIIFSDIEMSGMTGVEMVRQIRKRDRTTPIIAITSKFDSKSCMQYREAGFTDWLQKPAKSDDIYSVVEGLSMTSL